MTEINWGPSKTEPYRGLVRLLLKRNGIDLDNAYTLGNTVVEIETLYRDGRREKKEFYLREIL